MSHVENFFCNTPCNELMYLKDFGICVTLIDKCEKVFSYVCVCNICVHVYVEHFFFAAVSLLRKCVLQCVAVCCSMPQCSAVCCSMLQCVAVCCSVLQYAAVFAVCYSVLQCVAVCCSVLQCDAVRCSVLQCSI